MSDFKTRLQDEKEQLDEKIEKLSVFIHGDNFKTVDPKQQQLLDKQLSVMTEYSGILDSRLDLLK